MLSPPGKQLKWKERETLKVLLKLSCFVLASCVMELSLSGSNASSAQTREVRVVNSSVAAGQTINLSIELVAQGNENAVGFSLNFNQSIFSNPVVTLGAGAIDALLNANTNQAAEGRIGVVLALPAGQTFSAGVRQVVSIAFNVAANAPAGPSSITFGDQPVVREVSDANATAQTTVFTNGTVTISQQNQAPELTGISPTSRVAGGVGFILTVNGAKFVQGSVVQWNGSNRATTFVSAAQLTAEIPAGDIANAGAAMVTVTNPAPGGSSNALTFIIASPVASVSAASFRGNEIATESIIAAFGVNLATGVESATMLPLPTTLGGTKVAVKDNAGSEQLAPLFFVGPTQVNYLMPPNIAPGVATVTVTSGDNKISAGTSQITNVAPGLFSANASGEGVVAAVALRVKQNGDQVFETISRFDSTQNKVVSVPIDLGPEGEQVFLLLFGTGFRFRSSLSAVNVKFGGTDAEVLYAGLSPDFAGLDQSNVRLPRSLIGRGEIDVVMIVDGKMANTVKVNIK
jgi:uncharacterized protein (TIGR03437 family)